MALAVNTSAQAMQKALEGYQSSIRELLTQQASLGSTKEAIKGISSRLANGAITNEQADESLRDVLPYYTEVKKTVELAKTQFAAISDTITKTRPEILDPKTYAQKTPEEIANDPNLKNQNALHIIITHLGLRLKGVQAIKNDLDERTPVLEKDLRAAHGALVPLSQTSSIWNSVPIISRYSKDSLEQFIEKHKETAGKAKEPQIFNGEIPNFMNSMFPIPDNVKQAFQVFGIAISENPVVKPPEAVRRDDEKEAVDHPLFTKLKADAEEFPPLGTPGPVKAPIRKKP